VFAFLLFLPVAAFFVTPYYILIPLLCSIVGLYCAIKDAKANRWTVCRIALIALGIVFVFFLLWVAYANLFLY
jgi:hypothetical protein